MPISKARAARLARLIREHYPGGEDHDQSDHGNWASGPTDGLAGERLAQAKAVTGPLVQKFVGAGGRVEAVPGPITDHPTMVHLAGQRPRGWQGGSWEDAAGAYDRRARLAVLSGAGGTDSSSASVGAHEVGHGVDQGASPGWGSRADRFRVAADAWREPGVPNPHFAQAGDAGYEEIYAEAIASYTEGGEDRVRAEFGDEIAGFILDLIQWAKASTSRKTWGIAEHYGPNAHPSGSGQEEHGSWADGRGGERDGGPNRLHSKDPEDGQAGGGGTSQPPAPQKFPGEGGLPETPRGRVRLFHLTDSSDFMPSDRLQGGAVHLSNRGRLMYWLERIQWPRGPRRYVAVFDVDPSSVTAYDIGKGVRPPEEAQEIQARAGDLLQYIVATVPVDDFFGESLTEHYGPNAHPSGSGQEEHGSWADGRGGERDGGPNRLHSRDPEDGQAGGGGAARASTDGYWQRAVTNGSEDGQTWNEDVYERLVGRVEELDIETALGLEEDLPDGVEDDFYAFMDDGELGEQFFRWAARKMPRAFPETVFEPWTGPDLSSSTIAATLELSLQTYNIHEEDDPGGPGLANSLLEEAVDIGWLSTGYGESERNDQYILERAISTVESFQSVKAMTVRDSDGTLSGVLVWDRYSGSENLKGLWLTSNPDAGGGNGTRLMVELARIAVQYGAGIELEALRDAIPFYERLGFQVTDHHRHLMELTPERAEMLAHALD